MPYLHTNYGDIAMLCAILFSFLLVQRLCCVCRLPNAEGERPHRGYIVKIGIYIFAAAAKIVKSSR